MHHVDYLTIAPEALQRIRKGAFLTVQSPGRINTMTIGWASIGFMWAKPMMTIMVRNTRHTYGIIEESAEYTVSVPLADMDKSLEFCGTKSGKDVDKISACGLEFFPGEKVKTPIIKTPGLHFECAIVYRSPLDPKNLVEAYTHLYPEKDYHTMYYGEIRSCYSTADE